MLNWNHAKDFGIPAFSKVVYTYVSAGAADNDRIATAIYSNESGTVLATLTFTYDGATNNVATIIRS